MPVKSRIALAIALLTCSLFVGVASAQKLDSDGLSGILRELFGEPNNGVFVQPDERSAPRRDTISRRVPFSQGQIQLSFAPLVDRTAPSVVNVYADRRVRQRQSPFAGDPFFEQFFGRQFQAPPRVQSALGSGVIVDGAGYVVTNNHVIDGADEIKVALPDGREFASTVVLKDESFDLAVLKINGNERFPALPIGDSDGILVGDLVLAIGNPFGVGQTTTSGIISALARSHIGISDYDFFIQTDASINPGNSGGALIDMNGRLIGINSAIYSQSGGSIGIGFAIPSNVVAAFVTTARSGAKAFERPYVGAQFDAVTADIAEALGMRRPTGAIVTDVTAGGPAQRAGLRVSDIVMAIDGRAVDSPDGLGYRLSTRAFGDTVTMAILRRGARQDIRVTLQKPPATPVERSALIDGQGPFAGAKVTTLDGRMARQLGLRDASQSGVVITEIVPGSPAQSVGFRPGDIVRFVSGVEIKDVETMQSVVASTNGRMWRFQIIRDGGTINQILRF
jgi:Do/DeqQ family serine protease